MNLTYSQLPAKLKVSRFFLCLLFMKLINSSINGTGVNILLANLWCISNRPVTTGGISIPEMLIPLEDLAKVVKMLSRVDRFASFVEFPGPLGFSREVVWKCWCRNFCFFFIAGYTDRAAKIRFFRTLQALLWWVNHVV